MAMMVCMAEVLAGIEIPEAVQAVNANDRKMR
jgi:hypothetical protein